MIPNKIPRPWIYVVDMTLARKPPVSTLGHRPLNALGFVVPEIGPLPGPLCTDVTADPDIRGDD